MDRDERPGRAKPLRSGRGAYIACSCFQDFLVRLRLGQNGNTALRRAHVHSYVPGRIVSFDIRVRDLRTPNLFEQNERRFFQVRWVRLAIAHAAVTSRGSENE
jgi:hypothetical protein